MEFLQLYSLSAVLWVSQMPGLQWLQCAALISSGCDGHGWRESVSFYEPQITLVDLIGEVLLVWLWVRAFISVWGLYGGWTTLVDLNREYVKFFGGESSVGTFMGLFCSGWSAWGRVSRSLWCFLGPWQGESLIAWCLAASHGSKCRGPSAQLLYGTMSWWMRQIGYFLGSWQDEPLRVAYLLALPGGWAGLPGSSATSWNCRWVRRTTLIVPVAALESLHTGQASSVCGGPWVKRS
jgi:hypothetical protein